MSAREWTLDPRLAADTLAVLEWPLCSVRLMDDAHYPWLVLVPRRAGIRELIDLTADDRLQLMRETDAASRALRTVFDPDKLNVAALGNVVSQLHMHVIARFKADAAWPAPVWGHVAVEKRPAGQSEALCAQMRESLNHELTERHP